MIPLDQKQKCKDCNIEMNDKGEIFTNPSVFARISQCPKCKEIKITYFRVTDYL